MRTTALALAAALSLGALARAPRAEVIDRVAAVLDEEAVFLSEVERRARPFLAELPQVSDAAERERLRRRVLRETLDRMIDDQLIRAAATRLHVTVTDEDVDQFIERLARERGATPDQVYEALEREGVTRAEYRAHMESEVRRLKVLQLRVRGRINITESDLQEAYRRFARENANAAALRPAHIFVEVPEGATPAQAAAAQQQAVAAAARVRAGEDFAAVARAVSQDAATRETGGDLGEMQPGDLPESLERALTSLPDGAVTDPVRGPRGFHVLRVVSRRPLPPPPFEDVRDRLHAALLNREMLRQQEIYIRELRRGAAIEIRLEGDAPPAAPASR